MYLRRDLMMRGTRIQKVSSFSRLKWVPSFDSILVLVGLSCASPSLPYLRGSGDCEGMEATMPLLSKFPVQRSTQSGPVRAKTSNKKGTELQAFPRYE